MPNEVFTAGVDWGGLTTQTDIKILVCYMLKSVPVPLASNDVQMILQTNGLANYFEITDAIASLLKTGQIEEIENNHLKITESGIEIASMLESDLPISVREKALTSAFSLLKHAQIEEENRVEIKQTEFGYDVTCHISGGSFDLMCFTLYVPDLQQANMVKKNFHKNPENFYKLVLSTITGDNDFAKSLM